MIVALTLLAIAAVFGAFWALARRLERSDRMPPSWVERYQRELGR